MTNTALHNAVRARFKAQVADAKSLTTVYDNDPTSPPADGSNWCRFAIRRADSEQIEAGPASFRKHGIAYAQLFGPVEKGDKELLLLADAIEAAFQGQTAVGVRYGKVTVRPVGNDRSGAYQVNVEIPFTAD